MPSIFPNYEDYWRRPSRSVFIETVHGTGYRFNSQVDSVSANEWLSHIAHHRGFVKKNFVIGEPSDSIAVLPLRNESGNPEIDYLTDGLTESLINSLSRIPRLKVIARDTMFRYKDTDADAKDVGEMLEVSAVLTGRINVFKDELIISVDLVKVRDGSQIWGTRFRQPFSDLIKIDDIASSVAENFRSELHPFGFGPLNRSQTDDAESYRLYLKGKYFLEKRCVPDIWRATELFEKSISKDPAYVLPYVETVECYLLLYVIDDLSREDAMAKIQRYLSAVNKFDQQNDAIQAMYGGIHLYFNWAFDLAAEHLQCALAVNSHSIFARFRYAAILVWTGRVAEALHELRQIIRIDPLSVSSYKGIGSFFYMMQRYENAIDYASEALELEPNDFEALVILGASLAEVGNHEHALDAFQRSLALNPTIDALSMVGYVHARTGNKERARDIIQKIKADSKPGFSHAVKLGRIYAELGEDEKSFECLDQALIEHDIDLLWLSFDPRWASNKDDRFRDLRKRVGLVP